MLSVTLIREFLRHPDADVRLAAAWYFDEAHDFGDATFADWWAVVDALGFGAALPLLHSLDPLPEDDATLTRLFDELRKGVPAKAWFSLRARLKTLPFALLERRIDDLRGVSHLLTPGDLRHAEERIALKSLPPDALWQKLMDHAKECEGRYAGEQDHQLVFRLTDALARHPDFATPRTLAILCDETIADWRENFAVELAGLLRCPEAIDPLIGKLRIDADLLLERARAALVRIGDPTIPARIAADWENEEWDFKNFAHGAIASFRGQESAALLRDLIAREEDEELQTFMSVSLLEMLPDDAATLEAARQFILTIPDDTGNEALDELLATVATMAGWDFPERAEWRARAIATEERMHSFSGRDAEYEEAVRAKMIEGLSAKEANDAILGPRRVGPPSWHDEAERAPAAPYIREAPKVGRNDPCPCKSGKKFKKCCGKAA